jgi:hypothetical protein
VVVNLRKQVVEQRRLPGDALLRRQVDALKRVLSELAELRPVLRREAEHVRDDADRDVLRVIGGGIHDFTPVEVIDERVAERPGCRL